MDRTDRAWRGRDTVRVLQGLQMPDVASLRRGLRTSLANPDHPLRRTVDIDEGLVGVVEDGDLDTWVDRMVVEGGDDAPQAEHALRLGRPLDEMPMRYVVGREWCAVQSAHAVADGWSSLTALEHLVTQARSSERLAVPWRVIGSRQRDFLTVAGVARRPDAALSALRRRNELAGGPYELAERRSAGLLPRTLSASAAPDFLGQLRARRAEAWPSASLASLVLVGLRRALGWRLPTPRAGAEIVFSTRDLFAGAGHAFGNWSAGLYVMADDDGSPTSVTNAVAMVRERRLPVLSSAATRLPRKRRATAGVVAAPTGRPRLALSHINAHGPGRTLPWTTPSLSRLDQATVPNGPDTITISSCELGGTLHLSLSFYPATWDEALVASALGDFLAEPESCLPMRDASRAERT